jgi:hypothetical protein
LAGLLNSRLAEGEAGAQGIRTVYSRGTLLSFDALAMAYTRHVTSGPSASADVALC